MPSNERPTGEQLRAARERQHLRQRDVAEQLGVTAKTVGRWERGEHVPRTHLHDLVTVLEIPTVDDRPVAEAGEVTLDDTTIESALRQASHLQIIGELARRIQANQTPGRELPPVPQVHLRWPKTAVPDFGDDADSDRTANETGA